MTSKKELEIRLAAAQEEYARYDERLSHLAEINKKLETCYDQLRVAQTDAEYFKTRAEAAERRVAELEEGIKAIDKAVDIQCSDGNWNYDPYMHGMANGLLLAQTYMAHPIGSYDAEHYKPLSAPERWLSDEPPTPSNSTGLTDSA